jgi:hypothetical protein
MVTGLLLACAVSLIANPCYLERSVYVQWVRWERLWGTVTDGMMYAVNSAEVKDMMRRYDVPIIHEIP